MKGLVLYIFVLCVLYSHLQSSECVNLNYLSQQFVKGFKLGPYRLFVESRKPCKVPYHTFIGVTNVDFIIDKKGDQILIGNYTLKRNVTQRLEVDVGIYTLENNTKIKLFRKRLPNLCDCISCYSELISPIVTLLPYKDTCMFLAGTKSFEINYNQHVHNFVGNNFISGRLFGRAAITGRRIYTTCEELIVRSEAL